MFGPDDTWQDGDTVHAIATRPAQDGSFPPACGVPWAMDTWVEGAPELVTCNACRALQAPVSCHWCTLPATMAAMADDGVTYACADHGHAMEAGSLGLDAVLFYGVSV